MAAIRQVAELINNGASLLIQKRDKRAMKTLQTALTIIESRMSSAAASAAAGACVPNSSVSLTGSDGPINGNGNTAGSNAAMTDTSSTENSYHTSARFAMDSTLASTGIPELKDDPYFIFNQALFVEIPELSALPASDTDCPPSLICFYTSVIIYNLALAYHKRAVVVPTSTVSSPSSPGTSMPHASATGPPSSLTDQPVVSNSSIGSTGTETTSSTHRSMGWSLGQSLRLYEHCLRLARSIANYSEDCKLLLYAVSCNLAHVYCRKGDRSRAQALLDGLEEANRLSYNNMI